MHIYKIVNTVNGKCYVGQTIDPETRWRSHRVKLRGGHHWNAYLQAAWNKYGEDAFAFDIVETLLEGTKEELNILEEMHIKETAGHNYNLRSGNAAGGGSMSEETKKRISESKRGTICTQATRQKISVANMGRIPPNKGVPCSEGQKIQISNTLKGRTVPEEVRKKISNSTKGKRSQSPETRAKLSEAATEQWKRWRMQRAQQH